ncbi:ATP-binding protein [Streptomyces sp. NPDC046939]|uniref:AlbA family DNA-binding domain-containing protein n=1 Tax=Streptomyces sp. NPDC046939 TaxID=3155376 RepID=UPI0033D93D39
MATPEEIEALLNRPEGVDLEFKPARVQPRVLSRIIAAFANTRGGTVIVGIDQRKPLDQGGLVGVDPEHFKRTIRAAGSHLSPLPDFQTFFVPIQGKQLGVVQVKASPRNTPVFHDGEVAVRLGTGITTVPFSGVVVGAPEQGASTFSSDFSTESAGRRKFSRRRRLAYVTIASFVIPSTIFLIRIYQGKEPSALVPGAIIIGISIFLSGFAVEFTTAGSGGEEVSRTRERVRQAEVDLEEGLRTRDAVEAQDEEQARLTLSDLWTVTHRRLDHYHGIALGQAEKSFRNAQAAMVIGFLLLIGFAVTGFFVGTTAGAIVAGSLGTVSAALSGYVSRTFVKSQETAAGHLRAYFDQPLEFSRYLAAERLITDARLESDQRAQILSSLVQTMIVGPTAPGQTQNAAQSE